MILLTGSTGFIGQRLSTALPQDRLRRLIRRHPNDDKTNTFISSIDSSAQYYNALEGVDVVIHTAARAHVMADNPDDSLSIYREVNTAGTINLASQAAECGVRRFIFLSSIKVNGEFTDIGKPFTHDELVAPTDPYAISKAEAEQELLAISERSDMEVVIIRPPLVYGPAVKANFASIIKLAKKNFPLPFGAIYNKRSLVAVDNLVDLILTCIEHPEAANKIFLVSDDHDLSTTELFQMITRAAGKKPKLIPFPQNWLEFSGRILGKSAITERLCGNLQVDITHTKKTLNWRPPVSVEEGIRRCLDDSIL